jgi:hypothetical protein
MIQRIQQSRTFKGICVFMTLNIVAQIVAPTSALALTGGPAQPEFSSFTPVGTTDMVDLSSGDLNYNIPLMDVGGYPVNMAYSSGVGMDDEASWVGLGWNLSVGQINRNVRGLPDDFKGDEMTYENHMKPNVTVGAHFKFTPNLFGLSDLFPDIADVSELTPEQLGQLNDGAGNVTAGLAVTYNNYTGFTIKPSVGVQQEMGNYGSVGFNVESGPDGLAISPTISIHGNKDKIDKRKHRLGANFGVSMNSRQGLTSMTLGMSKKTQYEAKKKNSDETVTKTANGSLGSSIGFTDNLYTPNKRTAMNTESFTVNAALGSEFFGGEGQGQVTAYGTIQSIDASERNKKVRAYGYQHTDHAGYSDILDFNREKDGAFGVNSTNLPVTNYTYDIYSVQGQGVSGMYRPYRNQVGYVFDPQVQDFSASGTLGLEFGVGNAAHGGADFEAALTSSSSGMWSQDNYILQYLVEHYDYDPRYEKVHFKNVGDLSTDQDFHLFDQVARYQPARVSFIGNAFHRRAVNELKYKYNGEGNEYLIGVGAPTKRTQRQARNQAIYNLTLQNVNNGVGYGPCVKRGSGTPEYNGIPADAKAHHTAEVQVVRNDGARYIYGLPVYNTVKKEASFSVFASSGDCNTGLVGYNAGADNSADNNIHNENFNRTTTPAYAHTYLLTSVLSTDYQDVDNNGPSENDLGSYTKFSYKNPTPSQVYRWRVPYGLNQATYNPGLNTDPKDDEGNYVYGEKQQLYVDKIETKTHIAFFDVSPRKDAKGVLGENGGLDASQNSYKLDKIRLYSKREYNLYGAAATPIKVVNFVYSYSLCPGVPNNDQGQSLAANELSNKGGKLTLKKVYFTYRNSSMGKYSGYKFHYNEFTNGQDEMTSGVNIGSLVLNSAENPAYNIKGYDSWGNYKPNTGGCANTSAVTAAEFPFTEQNKSIQDVRAAVWSMKSIDLPSGGVISVTYESDDYAYVQNKAALRMYKVAGAGRLDQPSSIPTTVPSDVLYTSQVDNLPNHYLYVQVPAATPLSTSTTEITKRFFSNLDNGLIHFRFFTNMTMAGGNATTASELDAAKFDYVTGYMQLDLERTTKVFSISDNDPSTEDLKYLSVPIKTVKREGGLDPDKQVNPIAKAAWQFGRKYLSKDVYNNSPNGNTNDIEEIVHNLLSFDVLNNLKEIFTGPNVTLENKQIGRRFIKDKSWIRLNESTGFKYGGGVRVKKVVMKDIWQEMNPGQGDYQTMSYGQQYNYTIPDSNPDPLVDNSRSSGVATYEPVGNKENPFVQPVFSTEKHLLAPDEDNYMEKPFGESFFPNPQVTYARVQVSSVEAGAAPSAGMTVKKLHKTGSVVTEYYTSKDYPTIVDQTILEAKEDDREVLDNILKLNVRKHFTASQGYVIHLNDMNGKEKSQRVYAEGQQDAISGVDYKYDGYTSSGPASTERNKGMLDNTVKVIYPNGDVKMKTLGVEYDIVHDFRANQSQTTIPGVNTNLATFFVGIPGVVPLLLPDLSTSEDQFRSVSTTKVINTFGILKETIAYDAGTAVSTRNLAWDALTGEVLVTETVDEYNDTYYTVNYPAHWYYKGMGQASRNLGITGTLQGSGGNYAMTGLPASYSAADFLIPGDEIAYGLPDANGIRPKAWVNQVFGNTFQLIGQDGTPLSYTANGQATAANSFTVIRSGHRNLQSAGIMNVTLMRNPLKDNNGNNITNLGTTFLDTDTYDWRIINAGAVDYSDNWPAGCECGTNNGTNPYFRNERGVWRTRASMTYLTGRTTLAEVTPRREGYFTKFSPYYKLSNAHNWYKPFQAFGNASTSPWTYVSEVSMYSPYGFELENRDALNRYSAAQYGYNNTFVMAVGANTRYREIGYDGFEDHIGFTGCTTNAHFSFREASGGTVVNEQSHTGKYSIKVNAQSSSTLTKKVACPAQP